MGFDTLTEYPDPDPETDTFDGLVWHSTAAAGVDWTALMGYAGTGYDDTDNEITYLWWKAGTTSNQWRGMDRSIFLFDTSGLGASANISATTMSLRGTYKQDEGSYADEMNVYSSAPASNTGAAGGDYNSFGSTPFSDTNITYAGFSTAGYNDFSFNSDGISAIALTGISKFGIRSAKYDVADVDPSWTSGARSSMQGYYSEQSGTTSDPKLVVTYTIGVDYTPTMLGVPAEFPVGGDVGGGFLPTFLGVQTDFAVGADAELDYIYADGSVAIFSGDSVQELDYIYADGSLVNFISDAAILSTVISEFLPEMLGVPTEFAAGAGVEGYYLPASLGVPVEFAYEDTHSVDKLYDDGASALFSYLSDQRASWDYEDGIAGEFTLASVVRQEPIGSTEGLSFFIEEPGPIEMWFSIVRDSGMPDYELEVSTTHQSNVKIDRAIDSPHLTTFSVASDYTSVGLREEVVTGDVAATFTADADHGWTYFGDTAWQAVVGGEFESSVGTHHIPTADGVPAFFEADHDREVLVGNAIEVGDVFWGAYGGVSTLYLDIDTDHEDVPVLSTVVGADYEATFTLQDVDYTAIPVVFKLIAGGDVVHEIGTIDVVGNVRADFAASHDHGRFVDTPLTPFVVEEVTIVNRGPESVSVAEFAVATVHGKNVINPEITGSVGLSTVSGADLGVGRLYDEVDDAVVFGVATTHEKAETVPLAATITGDVASFFALSHDRGTGADTPILTVFSVAGAVQYEYVEPVDEDEITTTYTLEPVPGRGAQAYGAYTEETLSGAHTENVGYAMSQGGERGAYTQDDAYLMKYKPNVFPTLKTVPVTTASTKSIPSSTETVKGKPTTTVTDEDKPVSE